MALNGLVFCLSGELSDSRQHITKLIEDNGGKVKAQVSAQVNVLCSTDDEVANNTAKVTSAIDKKIPIVSEEFIRDSVARGKQLTFSDYAL